MAGVGGDPEVDLEVLDVAVARWPEVEALVLRRAGALAALGEGAAAEGALRAWLAGHPGSGEARVMLAQALVERGAWEEARSLAGVLAGGGAPFDAVGRGLLIRVAQAQGDVGEARRLLEAEVVASPEDTAAAMSLAGVLHSVGDSAAALGVLDRVAARSGAGPWDVWRLVHGTLLDRWETVRDAAGRLGLVVPGSGAVEGEWEVVRVRIEEADGSESVVWARRTGPVSARVLTMEGPGRVAHYRDEVVFDPRPLAEEDEGGFGGDESGDGSSHGSGAGAWEDEWEGDGMEDGMADGMEGDGSERQAWDGDDSEDGAGDEGGGEGEDEGGDEAGEEFERPLLYAAMAIKRPGGFRVFSVDGLHPGEDELGELYMALEDLGAHPRVMSGPEYRLVDPKSGEARPAVYLYVAVEVERMRALDSALALFGARWGTPLVWPELLGVVGAKRRLEAQHAVMEAWGM